MSGMLPGLAVNPDALIAEAHDRFAPVTTFCLFSGGHDSTVLAHRCRDDYDQLAFIDTGTAVPGVTEWVHDFAEWIDKPLIVLDAADAYERMVLGSGTWWDGYLAQGALADRRLSIEEYATWLKDSYGQSSGRIRGTNANLGDFPHGFPGPAQHGRAYSRLKERQIEKLVRDAKDGVERDATVLLLTGKRRAESARRGRTTMGLERRGGQVYGNPLVDWSAHDMRAYRNEHNLPESPVAALLHRSGDCCCGAFATEGEREMLRSLWPDWFEQTIGRLERKAEELGIAARRWGQRPPGNPAPVEDAGPLCSDCQLRFEA